MSKRLALALLIGICLASGARAGPWATPPATWEVPPPNIIPLQPHYEVGARYWWSEGKTNFSIDSSKMDPSLGLPSAKLTYDNVQGNAAEFVFRAWTEANLFAKGFVGGGMLSGGTLDGSGFSSRAKQSSRLPTAVLPARISPMALSTSASASL